MTYLEQRRQMKITGVVPSSKREPKPIAKKSAKKIEQEKAEKEDGKELQAWFEARRKEMTGICQHCGGKTTKDDDKLYKHSVAHILPKRDSMFPSVKTDPNNWIELCFYGNSCHTNYDAGMLDLIDLNCFDTVIGRFVKMFPDIATEERRKIPSILMQYVEVDL